MAKRLIQQAEESFIEIRDKCFILTNMIIGQRCDSLHSYYWWVFFFHNTIPLIRCFYLLFIVKILSHTITVEILYIDECIQLLWDSTNLKLNKKYPKFTKCLKFSLLFIEKI